MTGSINSLKSLMTWWKRCVNGWAEIISASVIFLVTHTLPARPAIRTRLTGLIGRRAYLTLYSLVSLVLLAWLIMAAGRAPHVGFWSWTPERAWLANGLLAIALWLAVCGAAIANPFSLGGLAGKAYDPALPGILAVMRHPLLLALVLWSLAHLTVNGDLAHILLFGSMGAFSLIGVLAMECRARKRAGPKWRQVSEDTSLLPFSSLMTGQARWSGLLSWRLLIVPAVWAVIVVLHRQLLGVSPLPPL